MEPEPTVNILLVDDRPENLLALEAILGDLGQNLVKAHSGIEALRHLLNQDFAVILLDVHMPDMDGFETATLIRKRERSQHTPIIFVTAFSSSEQFVYKGYSLGAVDYLFKPIEPEVLKSKVTVFVDLFKKTAEIQQKAAQLAILNAELTKRTQEIQQKAAQLAASNAELRESEARFRSLSASSPVGIFMADLEGRCTYTNHRCQTIFGFTGEEGLGEGWVQFLHPEDRDRIQTSWLASIRQAQEYSQEFRIQTRDGTVKWVHTRSCAMQGMSGEALGYVGTVEDITERKQAEEANIRLLREQVARQEAEAANRMKDEFLATLSHELRTPLTSILGWAAMLRTRNFNAHTTAKALETIERNAKAQAQLIEDILDVSRIIRGKLHLNLCPVNLISVSQAAIDAVHPAADVKGIQLHLKIMNASTTERGIHVPHAQNLATDPFSLPTPTGSLGAIYVLGDPNRLQQVIWNLLSNAIKFTPQGGEVEVQLSTEFQPNSNGQASTAYAQIQVTDTGIGINPEFLPYVFDRFRQADGTSTRSYSGLGLGLAIVRHLVELHGGSVHADSGGEGKGATFSVRLPLPQPAKSQQASSEKIAPDLSPEKVRSQELGSYAPARKTEDCSNPLSLSLQDLRILVVDDEPDTRELLTVVLESYGCQVRAVKSAGEAIAALAESQPDVLISDIGMPNEDGYSLIRQVRNLATKQGWQIPAVALTAYAKEEDCAKAVEAGFQKHLSKPVNTTELVMTVANLAEMTTQV